MDGEVEVGSTLFSTPSRVSLVRPSRARRSSLSARLSPAPPPQARRRVAWLSLQGCFVGADEATSAKAVGGLSMEEAAAWELFSPMQRVLVVAVVAAATKESRKGVLIAKLKRSVDIRDEVLQNMERKLDELCQQMNSSKDQPIDQEHKSSSESEAFTESGKSESKEAGFCSCGRSFPQLTSESGIATLSEKLINWPKDVGTESCKIELFNTNQLNMGEPEERRMSDLSDFSSCTSSSVDIQLSSLAEAQGIYNLRKECEEKDATIRELSAAAYASSIADSKRIIELEEIIKRKNMIITKLKKDMLVLEQKVIQLTRKQRPSTASSTESETLPTMATNILYDMSSSSPSSSDSDSPVQQKDRQSQIFVKSQSQPSAKSLGYSSIPDNNSQKHRSVSPIKRGHIIARVDSTGALRPKRLVSTSADSKRTRRRTQQESNSEATQKRWV